MNATLQHWPVYTVPLLTSEDKAVLREILEMRKCLSRVLRKPKRWEGGLRRSALAKAIQGSNSIEGYDVSEDDAAAAMDGEGTAAHLWLSFNLRAHHMQAQTVAMRFAEASEIWLRLDLLIEEHSLPERVANSMFDAVLGHRIRRGGYAKHAEVEGHTGTRDLGQLVKLGIFESHGSARGRFYTAGGPLLKLRAEVRSQRTSLRDPYPWMRSKLAAPIDSGQA